MIDSTKLLIISCGGKKRKWAAPARDLYTGPLFRASWHYAQQWEKHNFGVVFILSATHGLVEPYRVLEPYNERMNKFNYVDKAARIARQLKGMGPVFDRIESVEIHAGRWYVAALKTALAIMGREDAFTITAPLDGLQVGQRLAWYKQQRGGVKL